MASHQHQRILGLLLAYMRNHGCMIAYVDGKPLGVPGQVMGVPPQVLRHKPDVLGILENGQICVGDAKTTSDIRSARTREQIEDFTAIELNGMRCQVFLGVPQPAKGHLKKILQGLALLHSPYLHVLYVPEQLIDE